MIEIFFGNYIRKEQYEIYDNIVNDIEKKQQYNIYQLLMGRGKTSVILPLIVLRYALNNINPIDDIIVCLPSHLVNDVYKDVKKQFSIILNKYQILKFNELRRKDLDKIDVTLHRHTYKNIYLVKKIIIAECNSLKSLKLNFIEYPNKFRNKIEIENQIKKKSLIIFDEFDSLFNPLSSDLNFPTGEKKELSSIFNSEIIDKYIDHIFTKIDNSQQSSQQENEEINFRDKKIYEIVDLCFNLIFRKDYGFPMKIKEDNEIVDSHDNYDFAVPYSYVNNPVKNSQFSNIDISLVLTILTYLKSEIRDYDIKNMIKIFKRKYKTFNEILYNDDIEKFIIPYDQIFSKDNYQEIYNTNLNKDIKLLNDILYIFENLDLHKQYNIKKNYLMYEILPKLSIHKEFYNCSFIDIMGGEFSEIKTGFSGTLNITLPEFNSENNEFIKINESQKDNGSMYLAILGLFSKNQELHKFTKLENKNLKINQLINIINIEQYDSFIDSGAFLIDFTVEEVIEYFKDNITTKNVFIYIDNNNEKKVIKESENWVVSDYKNDVFDTNDLFIYYDNKHIVGTDIKQPSQMKGLASVSSYNKITDISQASFRLRQLNYGHTIDYIIDYEIEKINDRIDLFNFLLENEEKSLFDIDIKKLEQNINYLKRITNKESYKLEKFIYYDLDNEDDYNSAYEKWFNENNHTNDNFINSLIKKYLQNFKNLNLGGVQVEQDQQQDQQQEQQQNLNRNLINEQNLFLEKFEIFDFRNYEITHLFNFNLDFSNTLIENKLYYSFLLGLYFYNTILPSLSNLRNIPSRSNNIDNLSLLKIINFYFLKKGDTYLIITPIEFEFLIDFMVLNKIEKNEFDIFDKDGKKIQIMYETNKSKKLIPKIIHIDDDNVDGIKYFIRYILGSKLKISEYFRLNKFIHDNPIYSSSTTSSSSSLNSNNIYIEILNNFKENFNIREYNYENILTHNFNNDNFLEQIKDLFNLNENIINNYSFRNLILELKNIFFQSGGFNKNEYLFRINYHKNKTIYKIKYNK